MRLAGIGSVVHCRWILFCLNGYANYIAEDGQKHRPVMLHRAVLGSFERFIGIPIESSAGRLPFWLAPRQVVVAAIVSDANDYCQEVVAELRAQGVRAELICATKKSTIRCANILLARYLRFYRGMRDEERSVSVRRVRKANPNQLTEETVTRSHPPRRQIKKTAQNQTSGGQSFICPLFYVKSTHPIPKYHT